MAVKQSDPLVIWAR